MIVVLSFRYKTPVFGSFVSKTGVLFQKYKLMLLYFGPVGG
jgi:hypothetical protein